MICRKLSYHAGSRWLVLEIEQEVPNLNSTIQRQDHLSPASFFLSRSLGYLFLRLSSYLHASCVYHPSDEYHAAASVGRKSEG
jgi:hypothetical protein